MLCTGRKKHNGTLCDYVLFVLDPKFHLTTQIVEIIRICAKETEYFIIVMFMGLHRHTASPWLTFGTGWWNNPYSFKIEGSRYYFIIKK